MTIGLKHKIGLGFFVVASLFLALVLFGNFIVKPKALSLSNIATVKDVKIEDLQVIGESTRYLNPTNIYTPNKEGSLTRDLAIKISQMIIEKNPNGPQIANQERVLSVLSTESFIQNAVGDALKNFDASYFQPEIQKSDIKVGENKDYFKNFQDIIQKNFADLTLKWESAKNNNFDQLISAYTKTIDEFYKLLVPENLSYIHQKEIGLLVGQKRITETLKDYENDPMQALLALQYSETLNKGFEELKMEIEKIMRQNK